MKKYLLAAVLCAASVTRLDAQTTTFYGCGTFSCHTAKFTIRQIPPINAYGQTFTESLRIDFTHVFSQTGGFFSATGSTSGPATFYFPRPIADQIAWRNLWSSDSEYSGLCAATTCRGTYNETLESLADAGYTVNFVRVRAFGGVFSPFVDPKTLTPEFIDMRPVPEPATWALLAGGLSLLGVVRRGRRRAA